MAKKQKSQSINVQNFFDLSKVEYVDGFWKVNDKSLHSVLIDIVLAPEAWTVRKEKKDGVFSCYGVEKHLRFAINTEPYWCKDIVLAWLRGLVEYVSSAIYCSTYRNTPGSEKEKYKAADAASASFEKQFL